MGTEVESELESYDNSGNSEELHEKLRDILAPYMKEGESINFCVNADKIEALSEQSDVIISNQSRYEKIVKTMENAIKTMNTVFTDYKHNKELEHIEIKNMIDERVQQNGFQKEVIQKIEKKMEEKANKETVDAETGSLEKEVGSLKTQVNGIEKKVDNVLEKLDANTNSKWELVFRIVGYLLAGGVTLVLTIIALELQGVI